jgi:hypothetical protein
MTARRWLTGLFVGVSLLAAAGMALAATTLSYSGALVGETHPWDDYIFYFDAGTSVTVLLNCVAGPLDPEVDIYGPGGFYANNDDSGPHTCAQSNSALLTFVAPVAGSYTIRASSYEIISDNDPTDENADGVYQLTLTIDGVYRIVQLPFPEAPVGGGWNPGDGRLNPDPGAPLAVYCDADSIYAYFPGYLEFDFALDTLGDAPAQNTLLTEGPTGARLYRLATGELQVNYAHGSEEYVLTWDACPASITTTRVYDTATRALLSEFTRRP